MKTISTLLLTLLLSCFGFAGESCKATEAAAKRNNGQPGARCDSIKTKTEEGGYNGCTVLSPSGAWAVCEKEDKLTRHGTLITHIYLERGKKLIQLAAYDDLGPSGQPIWSPDSSKFAFPYTSGGAACCWDVDIFDLKTGRRHAIATAAQRDMAKRLKCEYSNVYFFKSPGFSRGLTFAVFGGFSRKSMRLVGFSSILLRALFWNLRRLLWVER